jgi:hypothetical protein
LLNDLGMNAGRMSAFGPKRTFCDCGRCIARSLMTQSDIGQIGISQCGGLLPHRVPSREAGGAASIQNSSGRIIAGACRSVQEAYKPLI